MLKFVLLKALDDVQFSMRMASGLYSICTCAQPIPELLTLSQSAGSRDGSFLQRHVNHFSALPGGLTPTSRLPRKAVDA
jgi:hypothetical protein